VSQVNNDVNHLPADELFGEFDDVSLLMTQVNSKWETLRSHIATAKPKFQMLAENYPTFTGE